jgi:hypothetical protein
MSAEPQPKIFSEPTEIQTAAAHKKRLLWLVGTAESEISTPALAQLLKTWDVVSFSDLLRVREALLMGARPLALVIQNTELKMLPSELIQRLKVAARTVLIYIGNHAAENTAARAMGFDHVLKSKTWNEDSAKNVDTAEGTVESSLLGLLMPNQKSIQSSSHEHPRVNSQQRPKHDQPQDVLVDSKSLVLQWFDQHPHRDRAGILMLGKVYFRSLDESQSSLSRPLRIALLKQKLRSEDDILADEQGRFWALLAVKDEMIAIRIALRLCLAMTRSSDPNYYAVGVGLAGAYINNSAHDAHRICESTLPTFETNGQVSVAVDRWRFSLPMSVAQALL